MENKITEVQVKDVIIEKMDTATTFRVEIVGKYQYLDHLTMKNLNECKKNVF